MGRKSLHAVLWNTIDYHRDLGADINTMNLILNSQKSTKDLKDEISETDISLNPLFKSIDELHKAATTINNQRKV